jgi:hypothetical protein
MKDAGNIVFCKCGLAMELVEGSIDYQQKDEQGKVIKK